MVKTRHHLLRPVCAVLLQPVLSYMKKLELHRKKCEREGKYLEARAASLRLAELKAKEAQRMRAAILQRQVGKAGCVDATQGSHGFQVVSSWLVELGADGAQQPRAAMLWGQVGSRVPGQGHARWVSLAGLRAGEVERMRAAILQRRSGPCGRLTSVGSSLAQLMRAAMCSTP